jgi:hypothetical protein
MVVSLNCITDLLPQESSPILFGYNLAVESKLHKFDILDEFNYADSHLVLQAHVLHHWQDTLLKYS